MVRPLAVRVCPTCHTITDTASTKDAARPKPGDWSVCLYCSAINRFDDDLQLRPTDDREKRLAALMPDIGDALEAVAEFRKSRGGR